MAPRPLPRCDRAASTQREPPTVFFRVTTNYFSCGHGLLGCLARYVLPACGARGACDVRRPMLLLPGPMTRMRVTEPAPSAARRCRSWVARSLTWVAHASESATRVSSPSLNDSGRVWAASWGPTISGHFAKIVATAARGCQPLADSRPVTAVSRGWGSSLLGLADHSGESGLSAARCVRSELPEAKRPEAAAACGRSPLAHASALALARASVARRTRSGSGDTGELTARQRESGAGQQRRDVGGDRGGDEDLLRGRDKRG